MSDRSPNIPTRLFKACRRCRKQKMRCDARNQIPCSRCQNTGHECILDPIGRQRTRDHRRNHHLTSHRAHFSPLSPTNSRVSPTGNDSQSGLEIQQFSPQDMIAPQSAMHSMSVNLGASREQIFMAESDNTDTRGDVIVRGIIAEQQARSIYERFMTGSKNFLPLFDPVRDTFDSIRSRSLFCLTVIIYLAARAVPELRSDSHLLRVLQDEAQRLAEDSFFERPTKLETVQAMILLAAYSEKTWFSTALILRTALDSGLEKSLDTLLAKTTAPRSYLSATLEDRKLVWQTRTWLISFTLELDVASGTGRKSRLNELDIVKLRKFLDYPLSLPSDMRHVCVIELHQLRSRSRQIIENASTANLISTELPAIMGRLQDWWTTWDEIHDQNGFHVGAFQRSSLGLMLNYARVYVLCATIARIQRQPPSDNLSNATSDGVLGLWKNLVDIIMSQLALLVREACYRCQLTWAPTYPALTIAFVTTFAIRIARWHPSLIDQNLVLQRVQQICEILKQPPYPDIHRTVSIFAKYAGALFADRGASGNQSGTAPAHNPGAFFQPRPHESANISTSDFDPDELSHPETENRPFRREGDPNEAPSSDDGRGVDFRPDASLSLSRLLGEMNVPNWNLSTSIADSFDLFEEGQSDVFDFLPAMPSIS